MFPSVETKIRQSRLQRCEEISKDPVAFIENKIKQETYETFEAFKEDLNIVEQVLLESQIDGAEEYLHQIDTYLISTASEQILDLQEKRHMREKQ